MISQTRRITVRDVVTAAVLALGIVICGSGLFHFAESSYGRLLPDFRAFYCAASVMASGRDPYLQEPLYSCEAQQTAPYMWHASGNVSNPAPLPPYALALFVPLTKIAYPVAAVVWLCVLLAAYVLTLLALRRATSLPWWLLAAAVLPGSLMSTSLGQVAPIAIALLCLSATLVRQQPGVAGVMLTLSLIEPHIALPSCIALFAVCKRCRGGMAISLVALGAASMSFLAPLTLQYLFEVLRVHAYSDVWDVGQFSATLVAHMAGAPDDTALIIGSLSYALSSVVGITIGVVLARRERDLAFLVLIPLAFAAFGGAYLHWQQVVAAVPAALLLSRDTRTRSSAVAAALILLPLPWLYITAWGFLIPLAIVVVAILTWHCSNRNAKITLTTSTLVFCALWFANHALPVDHATAAFKAIVRGDQFADASWGQYVRARIPTSSGVFWCAHFPTWAALAALLCAAVARAAGQTNAVRHAGLFKPETLGDSIAAHSCRSKTPMGSAVQ